MYFAKSVDAVETITKEAVLADIRKRGGTVLRIVTDVPDEAHVLAKSADGRQCRHYFDYVPVEKAVKPTINTEFVEECARVAALMNQSPPNFHDLSLETRAKLEAKYGQTEEEPTMLKQAEKDAIAKMAVADAEQQEFDNVAATTFEKLVNEIRKRDECTARAAMEQAAMEHPKAYEAWQTGQPVGAS